LLPRSHGFTLLAASVHARNQQDPLLVWVPTARTNSKSTRRAEIRHAVSHRCVFLVYPQHRCPPGPFLEPVRSLSGTAKRWPRVELRRSASPSSSSVMNPSRTLPVPWLWSRIPPKPNTDPRSKDTQPLCRLLSLGLGGNVASHGHKVQNIAHGSVRGVLIWGAVAFRECATNTSGLKSRSLGAKG
jgi:hypothetical protein